MELIEKAIGAISPKWSLQRKVNRMMCAEIDSQYLAASQVAPSMKRWHTREGGPNTDYSMYTQSQLIARCQDAYRNFPLARAILNRMRDYVIGPGLKVQAQIDGEVLGFSEQQTQAAEKYLEQSFDDWACSTSADYFDTNNLYELQSQVYLNRLLSGDSFVNTPVDPLASMSETSLRLQVIEASQVSNPQWGPDVYNMIRGVEMDDRQRPVGYHVIGRHPNEAIYFGKDYFWERIPRRGLYSGKVRLFHNFVADRPGQVRGIPILAPVLHRIKELDRYGNSELTAAVVSSKVTGFIESMGGWGMPYQQNAPAHEVNNNQVALGNGTILRLRPGEKMSWINPTRPNTNYEAFVYAGLREIGAAMGIPIEFLLLHFESSYTAARAAILQADKFIEIDRCRETDATWSPTYRLHCDEKIAKGELQRELGINDDRAARLMDYNSREYRALTNHKWVGQDIGSVDERVDVQSARERIELGVSNRKKEMERLNLGDFDANHAQLVAEEEKRRDAGLANTPTVQEELIRSGTDKEITELEQSTKEHIEDKKIDVQEKQQNNQKSKPEPVRVGV